MNQPNSCPECGVVLPAGTSPSGCPACLLKRGFEPTKSEAATDDSLQLEATYIPPKNNEPSSASREPTVLSAGDVFGDYKIQRRLGRGGMGVVYEADQLKTGRRVALKVLSHSLESREARTRFLREGRLAASINHPNSVYVFGTEEIDGVPTISMELVSGGTLASVVQSSGPMEVAKAVDAILQVIDGLEAAERKGVLHRDVKPANCFVDEFGDVKIGDFGLSVSTEPHELRELTNVSREGVFLGTPAFASPEQLRGEPLDQRSDIYAVGVTLYFLLTGKAPFSGKNMVQLLATVLDKQSPSVRNLRAEIPQQLANVIESCLAKSAGARPGTYADLKEILLPFSSKTPVPASLGQRTIAGVIDYLLLCLVPAFVGMTYILINGDFWRNDSGWYWLSYIPRTSTLLYYSVAEAFCGATFGKWLLGLKVDANGVLPKFRQTFLRTIIYVLLPTILIFIVSSIWSGTLYGHNSAAMMQPEYWWLRYIWAGASLSWYVIRSALFLTARKSNGLAGIHDKLTGIRVVQVPEKSATATSAGTTDNFAPDDSMQQIGPYHVLQSIGVKTADQRLLLGYDPKLLRRVWLQVRSPDAPAVSHDDRGLSRITRLRWLGGQREKESWDCYEAPEGRALLDPKRIGNWTVDRRVLTSLANELHRSIKEGTLPKELSLSQVWIEGQHGKLLPVTMQQSVAQSPVERKSFPSGESLTDQRRACQDFLLAIADHLINQTPTFVQTPFYEMPESVRHDIKQMESVYDFEQMVETLHRLADSPAKVTRQRRLALYAATFCLPAYLIFSLASNLISQNLLSTPRLEYNELSRDIRRIVPYKYSRNRETIPDESVSAMEIWIAGRHRRDFFNNQKDWNSVAKNMCRDEQKPRIEKIMATLNPTADEIAAARTVCEQQWGKDFDVPIDNSNFAWRFPAYSVFSAMWFWGVLVWIPGLVAAITFRGGLLLRSLGVALVNSDGQPASRLRIFLRMLIQAVPFALAVAVAGILPADGRPSGSFFQSVTSTPGNCLIAIVLVSVMLSSLLPTRFLADRITGCYLVPR